MGTHYFAGKQLLPKRRVSSGSGRRSNSSKRSRKTRDLDSGSLISIVRDATSQGGVVTWAELRDEFQDLKRLRNLVRGLVRNGELEQDRAGNYYLPGASGSDELCTGLVVEATKNMAGRLAVRVLEAPSLTLRTTLQTDELLALPAIDRSKRATIWPRIGDEVKFLPVGTLPPNSSPPNSSPTKTDSDQSARSQLVAQIVEVSTHSSAPIVGVLERSKYGAYIDSLSPDYRGRVALDNLPDGVAEGDTVSARITGSDRHSLRGDVTGVISRGDVADAAAVSLIASHGVPEEWPDDAVAQAQGLPSAVQPGRFRSRTDLQSLPLVTIDGADARDFDDAVFAEAIRGGGWRLVVAIADVAHYVKSASPLDNAAFERGNSVYLPDRVIPMLPKSLSNGLCSLRPNEPRLSLVCDMKIAKSGRITAFEFYDAVICSWARLTYSQVNSYYEGDGELPVAEEGYAGRSSQQTSEGVRTNVDELRRVYSVLLKARSERGALEFETRSGVLKIEEGRVAEIIEVTRNDAHRLIEEAMISANVCAAKFIGGKDARALYRVHEPPQAEKQDVLRDALAYAGIRVRDMPSDPKALATLLEPLSGRDDAWLLYSLILRAMSQACYQPENKGHFGLALTDYMHFTSPIRRYPDLIVHRVIKALVRGKRAPLQAMDKLIQAGDHLSTTERRAEDVERGVSNWLKCDFVAGKVGETFAGTVVGVQDFGLFVELDGYFVQGLVHISNLGEDYFNFQPASQSLVGDRSGRSFQLGDQFEVVLLDVQAPQGKLDLVPAEKQKTARNKSAGNGRKESPKRSRNKKGRNKR